MDWHSRKVLACRLSNTVDTSFCAEVLNEVLAAYRPPEIFNTAHGVQFTRTLADHGIQVSMDGRGRWLNNVFIERLWRSVKYEQVYLKAYDDGIHARQHLETYFQFYNNKRHQSPRCLTHK